VLLTRFEPTYIRTETKMAKSSARSKRYVGAVKSREVPAGGESCGVLNHIRESEDQTPFSEGVSVPNKLRRTPRHASQEAQPEREIHGTPFMRHYGRDHVAREAERLDRETIHDRHFVGGVTFRHEPDQKDNANSLAWESTQKRGGANNAARATGRPQYNRPKSRGADEVENLDEQHKWAR
jgi:hypothetical protein